MLSSRDELNRFLDRRSTLFEQGLLNWLAAAYEGTGRSEDAALLDLTKLMRETMILADLQGRRRTLLEHDHLVRMEREGKFADLPDRTPIVYGVTFDEALEDLLTRDPRLARSAEEVSRLYSTEHVFAMAKSASMKLTERVQEALSKVVSEGRGQGMTENEILRMAAEESHDWTRSYASTVYRTNLNHAYNNGHFQQARDPDVAKVIKAMEYVGMPDTRTRPNHKAAFGLIAAVDDPVWDRARPPLGYQCRCATHFVSKFTLERRGLLASDGSVIRYEPPGFSGFHPDPGFKVGAF